MVDQSLIPSRTPDLVWRSLDDGTVVASLEEGKVRVLNEAGGFIWSHIDGSHSVAEIAQALGTRFDLSDERALNDVNHFLAELSDRGLICWQSSDRK